MKDAFIVGAGSFERLSVRPKSGDLVIAADGGYHHLMREEVMPDVLLGDFDSLEVLPEHCHIIRHSPIKDDTDMALAAEYALQEGCGRLFLYGGLGGRMDHSIANLQLLAGLSHRGVEAYLIGEQMIFTAVTDGTICFPRTASGMISVFCMGDQALGVTETNLKYTLNNYKLTGDCARGVSNEFTGEEGRITVTDGTLLICWAESCGLPLERAEKRIDTKNDL